MLIVTMLVLASVAVGCSSGGVSPVTPTATPEITANSVDTGQQSQSHLWGYWDVYIDIQTQTVEAVPNHHAEFAANVVSFLNSKGGLGFDINNTLTDPGGAYVDVDIDVSLTHPLSGLPMYDGYDVRGIFVAEGSQSLMYDTDLDVSNLDDDQYMLDDPENEDGGGADGYSRWFNAKEFTAPGLLGYLPGNVATPGYTPLGTLNPYKYFADDLDAEDDVWDFLTTTTDNGVFSSGTTNTRNYYLRFPFPPAGVGVSYGYAVVASWVGEDPEDHPANAMEAQAVSVSVTPDIYYVDDTDKGGDLIADISVFDWGSELSAGVMEDYIIYVESDQFTNYYMADTLDMTATGGDATYSTYHVEVPADAVSYNSSTAGHDGEYWVIVEYPDGSYEYPEDPAPPAPDALLAAFFRFNDLYIADEPYHIDPDCDLQTDGVGYLGPGDVDFDISGSTYYDGAVFASAEWDFDGDGIFGETPDDDFTGTEETPTHTYTADFTGTVSVNFFDDMGGEASCGVDIDVTLTYYEDFTTDPGDWCLATYQFWSGCSQGVPCWRSDSPYGVASGALATPCTGSTLTGGALQTCVSPPFDCPVSSEVNIRVRAMWDLGSSYSYFTKTTFRLAVSSATGCTPFGTTNCTGGTVLQRTTAHGGGSPSGWNTSSYIPCNYIAGWSGSWQNWPTNITAYIDLSVPASFHGSEVKLAFFSHPDWCGYPGSYTGQVLDDVEVVIY